MSTNPSKHCGTGIISAQYQLYCQNGISPKLFSHYQGNGHLLLCTPPFWWAIAVNCYPTRAKQSFNSGIRHSLQTQYQITQYVTVLLHCYLTGMVPVQNCLAITKVRGIALHTSVLPAWCCYHCYLTRNNQHSKVSMPHHWAYWPSIRSVAVHYT